MNHDSHSAPHTPHHRRVSTTRRQLYIMIVNRMIHNVIRCHRNIHQHYHATHDTTAPHRSTLFENHSLPLSPSLISLPPLPLPVPSFVLPLSPNCPTTEMQLAAWESAVSSPAASE